MTQTHRFLRSLTFTKVVGTVLAAGLVVFAGLGAHRASAAGPGANTATINVVSGTHAVDGSPTAFTGLGVSLLQSSNNLRLVSGGLLTLPQGIWPKNATSVDENRYMEFVFDTSAIPANAIIRTVELTQEYQRTNLLGTPTLTGAKLEVWNGTDFSTQFPVTIGGASSDVTDTFDLSSIITTAAQANGLKARFLAYRGTNGNTWTAHDLMKVVVTYDLPPACDASSFDSFALGSVNGQNGWSATGPYDQAVVSNIYGYPTFGCQTLRLSDAVTSGSFGDWIFTNSNTDEAGETSAANGGFSGGTRQNHFEAQFDIASANPEAQQTGLHASVSPDRGDGARMSYLRFEDQADGIHVFFDDVSDAGPLGTVASFNETEIAGGAAATPALDRSVPHTAKFVMDLLDGPSNDIVRIYIDGNLVKTGTSWEDYYRFDPEQAGNGNQVPTVDSLIIQARGTATPANIGKGFLFDNLALSSSLAPTTVKVTIAKYLNGSFANAVSANSAAFPMWAIYPGGQGAYTLSTVGFNNAEPYKATTSDMPLLSEYSTYENAPESCTAAYPYKLYGYTTGDTLNDAEAGTVTSTVPAFTDLTGDKFVIVWNKTCPPAPTLLSPADNSTLTTATWLSADWSDVTDWSLPVTYIYESANTSATNSDGSFVSPVYVSGPLATSEIPTPGTPAGTYYWHARAVDNAGNPGPWAAAFKTIVDNTPPDTIAPTANLVFATPGPAATGFQVVFSEPVIESEAINAANYFLNNWPGAGGSGDLAGDATVTYDSGSNTATITFTNPGWYISAEQQWGVTNIHDSAGNLVAPNPTTEYSTPLVNPEAPGAPTTASPTTSTTQNWTWTAANDPGGTDASGIKSYEYEITGDATVGWTDAGNTLGVTTNLAVGSYTMHVRAIDNAGNVGAESTGDVTVNPGKVKVHIFKYLYDGDTTTQIPNDSTAPSFPMIATYAIAGVGTNLNPGDGYFLGDGGGVGGSDGGLRYAANTIPLSLGDRYGTYEVVDGNVVVANAGACSPGKYYLIGYQTGTSLGAAEGASPSATSPDFQNIASDQYVIVVNQKCPDIVPGSITVYKDVLSPGQGPVSDTQAFAIQLNDSDERFIAEGSSTTYTNLAPGVYTITETIPANYTFGGYSEDSGLEDNGAQVTVTAGQNTDLTITNLQLPASLTVRKIVNNPNGGRAVPADFTMSVTGGNASPASFPGDDTAGVTVSLDPGSFSVGESGPIGYSMLSQDGDCTGTIGSNESLTCTITNSDIPAGYGAITVIKNVTNDNLGTLSASNFTIHVKDDESEIDVETSPLPGSEAGTVYTLAPGSYTISEEDPTAQGYTEVGVSCAPVTGGDAINGPTATVSLSDQQGYVCTITNDDIPQPAHLTIVKQTNAASGDGSFQFTVAGASTTVFSHDIVNLTTVGQTATSEDIEIPAGDFNVNEINLPGGWRLADVSCAYENESIGNSIAGGERISVDEGDEVTCTFTNVKQGTLVVKKVVVNDNAGAQTANDFSFQINGTSTTQFIQNNESNPLLGENRITVDAGTYAVTEVAADGYAASLEGCSAVTVPAGGEATCTITNDDNAPVVTPPPVTVGGGSNSGGGNGPSGGGGGGAPAAPQGQVLGVSTTTDQGVPIGKSDLNTYCSVEYLTSYLGRGKKNDPSQVKKLQSFLSENLGINLSNTGFFGNLTLAAVKQFQLKYAADILAPWVPFGLPNSQLATGYVYKTTKWKINVLMCPPGQIVPLPPQLP